MQVLVVEDELKIANLLRRALVEEHYAVDIATDGEMALENCEYNEYDLIILDRLLPKIDGLEVCRQIRLKNTNIPILMLTAKGDIEDKVAGLDSGADDYLTKPFSLDELMARIRSLLRRGSTADLPILEIADLKLDPSRHLVTRSDIEISLTAKEYALLEYFLRNKNLPLSKTQILEHVWDFAYDGYSNIIQTYIKYLRRKLTVKSDSAQLIHTVRGHGYVLKIGDDDV